MVVRDDESVIVGFDSARVYVQRIRVRPPAECHEQFVALERRLLAGFRLGEDTDPLLSWFDGSDAVAGVDLVALARDLGECLGHVGVLAGDERVQHLDDGHVDPHRVEEVAEFDGDVTPAHYD